jgi:hypothetical protein
LESPNSLRYDGCYFFRIVGEGRRDLDMEMDDRPTVELGGDDGADLVGGGCGVGHWMESVYANVGDAR